MSVFRLPPFPICILICFVVLLGNLHVLLPLVGKPADRSYTGLSGYVDDYVGYVSYIKEGMSGRSTVAIRSLPSPQETPTSILQMYLWLGRVGGLFGWNAPLTYHLGNTFFALLYLVVLYNFLGIFFPRRLLQVVAFMVCITNTGIGWYTDTGGGFVFRWLSQFGFVDNVALRFVSRPHYSLGATLFLALLGVSLGFPFGPNGSAQRTRLQTGGLLVSGIFLGTLHASFAMLLVAASGVQTLWVSLTSDFAKAWRSTGFLIGVGTVGGLLLSAVSTRQYPFRVMYWVEPYLSHDPISWQTAWGDMISFGPTLWIGCLGLFIAVWATKAKKPEWLVVTAWLAVQLMLFLFLFRFLSVQRVRFIQSLYFIPMAMGTVYLVDTFAKKVGAWLVPVMLTLLLLLSLPPYIYSVEQSIHYQTDLVHWNMFIFPTRDQMAGYRYLDTQTPKESVVLADWEAANNIIMYSHNFVIGNPQGWPPGDKEAMEGTKDFFASGAMEETSAREYVKQQKIAYIFFQNHERSEKLPYPFIERVFENTDVTIYKTTE